MKAAPFDYVRPRDVQEASAALAQPGLDTAAVAGGQSLLPMLNLRVTTVDLLVDIGRLEELKAVRETAAGLEIGALITHAAIEDGKVPDLFNGLLRRVAGQISYRAVRNHGTIGGSVALADPAADWPGCLMALGARVRIAGRNGVRMQPIAEFVLDAYTTTLAAGEIVLGFEVPRPDGALRWGFAKVARKSGAFAESIACVAGLGRGGAVSVVVTGAASHPVFLPRVGERLQDDPCTEESLRPIILEELASRLPDGDAYRARLHTATVLRAIREARPS
jgi:aerobic carbon-monoxide dehydrogenase medium subunit